MSKEIMRDNADRLAVILAEAVSKQQAELHGLRANGKARVDVAEVVCALSSMLGILVQEVPEAHRDSFFEAVLHRVSQESGYNLKALPDSDNVEDSVTEH